MKKKCVFYRRNIAFAFNDVMKENESITTKVKRHFSRRYVNFYHTHFNFFLSHIPCIAYAPKV